MSQLSFREESLSEKERRNIAILETLRRRGPLSKPDISQELNLNVVTISNYIDDYLKSNLVFEKEFDVSEGGRRPVLIDLNAQGGYAIGVGLNLMNIVGILTDLKGNIIFKTQVERPPFNVKEIVDCIQKIIREILKRSKEYSQNIKGIGIGIAGLVNKKEGTVYWPEKIGDNYVYASVNLPLRDLIQKEFNLPVVIENDATVACFGEQWINLEPAIKNVVYMFSGVGCGIMINGQLYTGAQGYAGEIAIHNYSEDDLFNCSWGHPCFLKRWEIDLGIVEAFKKNWSKQKLNAKIDDIDLTGIFNLAKQNNPIALEVLDIAAKRLGIRAAYLVNIFNPDVLVIGGGFEEAGDAFLSRVKQTIKDWAFKEMTDQLKVVYSQLRENAIATGAAGIIVRKVFAQS